MCIRDSITTALYTELARDAARHDDDAVREGVARGIAQMLFILIPFALYLIVFSEPLNMVYCVGKFGLEGVSLVSEYLCWLCLLYTSWPRLGKRSSSMMSPGSILRERLSAAIPEMP